MERRGCVILLTGSLYTTMMVLPIKLAYYTPMFWKVLKYNSGIFDFSTKNERIKRVGLIS